MPGLKYRIIGAGFETLARSGVAGLVRRAGKCRGVIFTMHRVLPDPPAAFAPNSILQITPDFLDAVIRRTKELGIEPVSLDEALRRIDSDAPSAPFAVFTFDDAYRDNRQHALPVLEKHECPFTLYVPTAFVDGEGEIWWQALEDIIAANSRVTMRAGTEAQQIATASEAEKEAAFEIIYARMRAMPEPERVSLVHAIAAAHGMDLQAHCRDLVMDWDELAGVAARPLCTIGAHTVHHHELAKLPEVEARDEIARSVAILTDRLGSAPEHLSYPIGSRVAAGDREYALAAALGLKSGVTTVPGGLYPRHRDRLHALPRISLNGRFQNPAYIDVFLTGALFSPLERRAMA